MQVRNRSPGRSLRVWVPMSRPGTGAVGEGDEEDGTRGSPSLAVAPGPPASLELVGVRVSYPAAGGQGQWVHAVGGVDVCVRPGEVVGVLGPNGAGKSSCFKVAVGSMRASSGEVYLDGQAVGRLPLWERARRGMCYIPQEASIFRSLTVEENVLVPLEAAGYGVQEAREALLDRFPGRGPWQTMRRILAQPGEVYRIQCARVAKVVEAHGLQDVASTKGASLSGGERRRAELARALAVEGHARYVLMDEPFAGVDPLALADLRTALLALAASSHGPGVLITDHNVRETLSMCDRAYIFSGGTVVAHGTPKQLLKNELVRTVYLGADMAEDMLRSMGEGG